MSIFTPTHKNSVSISNVGKNSSTFSPLNETIHPWKYGQSGFTYGEVLDLSSKYQISYGSIGSQPITNRAKS